MTGLIERMKKGSKRKQLTENIVGYMRDWGYDLNQVDKIRKFHERTIDDMLRSDIMSKAQANQLSQKVTIREVQKAMRAHKKWEIAHLEERRKSKENMPAAPKASKVKGPKETFREFTGDDENLEYLLGDSLDNIQSQSDIENALENVREDLKSGDLDDSEEGLAYDLENELVSYAEYLKK